MMTDARQICRTPTWILYAGEKPGAKAAKAVPDGEGDGGFHLEVDGEEIEIPDSLQPTVESFCRGGPMSLQFI